MDIEQLSSQAANVYDDNSFIRVDHSRREQPTDNTCRPVNNPVPDRGRYSRSKNLYPQPAATEGKSGNPGMAVSNARYFFVPLENVGTSGIT
jgi:hypothetical protein